MKRGLVGHISNAKRLPCEVRLDRLVFGATGRTPSRLLGVDGFQVVADFRPHRTGKIAVYGRVRKLRTVRNFSQTILQYERLVPWVDPWRVTMIADDSLGLTPEDIAAVIVHCADHKVSMVELAIDFAPDVGVGRKFVLRHGVFGRSRRQSDPAGQGNLRYGTRTSWRLVRCYPKRQINCYRVELESHRQLLHRSSISRVEQLGSFASRLCPDHVRFVDFRWNKLQRYLIRRFGCAGQQTYEEVERRAARSLRLATRFLSEQGVANTHRFLQSMAVNDEIQSALDKWATWFTSQGGAKRKEMKHITL